MFFIQQCVSKSWINFWTQNQVKHSFQTIWVTEWSSYQKLLIKNLKISFVITFRRQRVSEKAPLRMEYYHTSLNGSQACLLLWWDTWRKRWRHFSGGHRPNLVYFKGQSPQGRTTIEVCLWWNPVYLLTFNWFNSTHVAILNTTKLELYSFPYT